MSEPRTDTAAADLVGPLEVGAPAHGGHCVARHLGRVIFVRHALPGEVVLVRLTDTSKRRYWRADAVEVIAASPDRVTPPCPIFVPGGCGGCDFQHVRPGAQLDLKTQVVREQLDRLGRYDWAGEVEPVEPRARWRTRMRYVTTAEPDRIAVGLRAHRSHRVVELPPEGCRIAAGAPPRSPARAGAEVNVVYADPALVWTDTPPGPVTEVAAGRRWQVAADGFWQIHPRAADTLVEATIAGLKPQSGETALDLYAGVGLFAGALVDAGVQVWAVEANKQAMAYARTNVPEARCHPGRVDRVLTGNRLPRQADLVVLDPPRTGAGATVMEQVSRRHPRALAYVACDPAALGRDLAVALRLGWQVESIRAFDLFPNTHHVECVAVLSR